MTIDQWLMTVGLLAGGPGSGRHKGFETLQKNATEEALAERRRLAQLERDKLHKQGLNKVGKPILSDKAQRAMANVVPATKEHHDRAEEVERLVTKHIGGVQSADNRPFDVTKTDSSGQHHSVEVKAVLMQKNDKLTMKRGAIDRKLASAKKDHSQVHTVAVDLRGPKVVVYHRVGVGSFHLSTMTKVKGGLKGLHNYIPK